jgi:hypothetical protein
MECAGITQPEQRCAEFLVEAAMYSVASRVSRY